MPMRILMSLCIGSILFMLRFLVALQNDKKRTWNGYLLSAQRIGSAEPEPDPKLVAFPWPGSVAGMVPPQRPFSEWSVASLGQEERATRAYRVN